MARPAQAPEALDLEIDAGGADGKAVLWALTRYLEPARSYVQEARYKWTSVSVLFNGVDAVTGAEIGPVLTSIAFTGDPFLQGMVPITAHGGMGYFGEPPRTVNEVLARLRCIFAFPETADLRWLAPRPAPASSARGRCRAWTSRPSVSTSRPCAQLRAAFQPADISASDAIFAEAEQAPGATRRRRAGRGGRRARARRRRYVAPRAVPPSPSAPTRSLLPSYPEHRPQEPLAPPQGEGHRGRDPSRDRPRREAPGRCSPACSRRSASMTRPGAVTQASRASSSRPRISNRRCPSSRHCAIAWRRRTSRTRTRRSTKRWRRTRCRPSARVALLTFGSADPKVYFRETYAGLPDPEDGTPHPGAVHRRRRRARTPSAAAHAAAPRPLLSRLSRAPTGVGLRPRRGAAAGARRWRARDRPRRLPGRERRAARHELRPRPAGRRQAHLRRSPRARMRRGPRAPRRRPPPQ